MSFHDGVDRPREMSRFAERYGLSPSGFLLGSNAFVSELRPELVAALRCEPTVRDIEPNGVVCTGNIVPGIVVVVYQGTSDSADASGVTGIVREGIFTDTLGPSEGNMDGRPTALSGASERPGIYTIYLAKPGFHPWKQAGVRVTKQPCHVATARVVAMLVPRMTQ